MGVYERKDSRYWWLWLDGAATPRVKTDFLIGVTKTERKDSREQAEREYYRRMLALGKAPHEPAEKPESTFADFAAWYDRHVVAHHRGAVREREILEVLKAEFGSDPVSVITRERVIEWRTRRAKKASASTSNRELAVLKHLLNAAVPKYLEASPIARLKLLRPARRETAILSRDDEVALLEALAPLDRPIVICALDTLMRLSDVVNLQRRQDRKTYLLVEDPKVAPYRVPVSSRLRTALDGLPQNGPYYFQHRRHKDPAIVRSLIKNMLARACKKAGIPYGRSQGGLTFHGLRHTGTTRLVEAGISLRTIQELGGWKSLRQLERYAHPSDAAKMAAVEAIGPPK